MKIISIFTCIAIGGIVTEAISARQKRAGGGQQISIEQASYFVSLRRSGHHVCGGALISTQHVLTAADCVYDVLDRHYLYETLVVSGADKINRADVGQSIKHISLHKHYPERFWYDIAVITLSAHIQWNDKQNKIELPNAEPAYDEVARFTGLQTKRTMHADSGLQQLRVNIEPFNPFKVTHDYEQIFYGTTVYPGSISNVDRGGPLVHEGRIIGIASVKSPYRRDASYFVNVVKFKAFIEKSMENKTSESSELPSEDSWPAKRQRL